MKHKNHRVEIYQDGSGEWRWRLVAHNGRVVADGAEGYASKGNATRGWDRVAMAIYDGHWEYA